jgi:hypothetical protein
MASTLALGPCITAILAVLRADNTLAAQVSTRIYPNTQGDVPQRPTFPYVSVESGDELPFNTMGPVNAAKWGSTATVQVRVASQTRSEVQVRNILAIVKAALDGVELVITGYGHAIPLFQRLAPLTNEEAGVVTREWVADFDVTVHQGST